MNYTLLLSLFALTTAVLTIRASYTQDKRQEYIVKPLTTILIILIAVLGSGETTAAYKTLIVIGLIFCLGGDVFLMLPQKYFIAGLGSFLIGHIFYIAAFAGDAGFNHSQWLLPLMLYGAIIYPMLHPHLGSMRLPVIVYIGAILVMAWQALARWSALGTNGSALAAMGAIIFVISDTTLAFDRFRRPFPPARAIVLSTYWVAQLLIALSI